MDQESQKIETKGKEAAYEWALRPKEMDEFVGQEEVRERLAVLIEAAKQRGETLGHCLLYGPPGLGKTTLSHIIAHSMGGNLLATSGPILERPADLAGLLTKLGRGDILFIDEIHRLSRPVEEYLYSAMEDFALDLMIDSGPSARSVRVQLEPFTLVGATTRLGLLTSPLRSRFGFSCRLNYYPEEVLARIVTRSAKLLGVSLDGGGALSIARRSRGTPRIANNQLRWVRDVAQTQGIVQITSEVVEHALHKLAVDHRGLEEMDIKLLSVLIDHYQGGPVGVNTLAIAVGEEAATLEEVYEPYLILQGFLKRTPRGREATALAYEHLRRS